LTSHQSGIYSLGGTVRARCSRSQKPEAIDLNRSEGGVGDPDRERLREFLHWTDALLKSMDAALRGEDPGNMWKHAGYRQFARKYVQIAAEVSRTVALPSVLDGYDVDKMPGVGGTQKEWFEGVYANAALLKGFLESKIGVVEDETAALRDFFRARLRSAVFAIPENERQVQDVVEQLLIGRGLQKGEDYDREVGRVKVSAKEAVPDFIMMKLGLAIEVKLVTRPGRAKEVVDEINADIAAYSKAYRTLLFISSSFMTPATSVTKPSFEAIWSERRTSPSSWSNTERTSSNRASVSVRYQGSDPVGCVLCKGRNAVGIDVQGEGHGTVPEAVGDDLRMDARSQRNRGVGMTVMPISA
jgi:hypothetical protein